MDFLILIIALIVIITIIILMVAIMIYQNKLFSPQKIFRDDISYQYTEVYIGVISGTSQVGKPLPGEVNINGRYYDNGGDDTLLFFHGNTGNISHRSYVVDLCRKIGYNLFLIDYQSYGKSQGQCDPRSILEDGLIAYDYLISQEISPTQIVVWGESLGGSVATYVAIKRRVRSLVLLSTFTSVSDIIRNTPKYPQIRGIFARIIDNSGLDLKPQEWIEEVHAPVLIIHSTQDELIPYHLAEKNYGRIKNPHKRFVSIQGGHASPSFSKKSLSQIFSFLGVKRWLKHYPKVDQALNNINPHQWT